MFPNSVFSDRHDFGSLKLAMVGVLTPWQQANMLSQKRLFCFVFSTLVKYLLARYWLQPTCKWVQLIWEAVQRAKILRPLLMLALPLLSLCGLGQGNGTSLSLRFLLCKMGLILVPPSYG